MDKTERKTKFHSIQPGQTLWKEQVFGYRTKRMLTGRAHQPTLKQYIKVRVLQVDASNKKVLASVGEGMPAVWWSQSIASRWLTEKPEQ